MGNKAAGQAGAGEACSQSAPTTLLPTDHDRLRDR